MQATWRHLSMRFSLLVIKLYRNTLSLYLLDSCRFSPTCSEYARQAIERFGLLKGSRRTICRLSRCHPLGGWGLDQVK